MFGWLKGLLRPVRQRVAVRPFDMSLFEGPNRPLFTALTAHWATASSPAPAPSDLEAQVTALEARYALRLPEDFRDYLLYAAPGESHWDEVDILWWPLADVKNIPDECGDTQFIREPAEMAAEADRYLVFADYMIWCWAWAICCSEGPNRGRIVVLGGNPARFVANSFRDFVALALVASPDIH